MTDLLNGSGLRGRLFAYQASAIAAFVVFALSSIRPIEVGATVAGSVLLVGTSLLGSWEDPETRTRNLALLAAGILVAVGLMTGPWRPYILVTTLFILPLALACGVLAWRGDFDRRGPRFLATGMLVGIVLIVGVLWIPGAAPPAADVLNLHASAAEVMLDGRNPYTDAYSVDTNPFAPEGAEFVGYTYPPLALLAYAGSDIFFGDSRWASVIAMALVAMLIVRPWRMMNHQQAAALIGLGLAVVVQPWLGTIFWFGWTDPIALPLLLGAGLLWRRHPVLSAVLFGLAFGTRQYMVLALPLLLFWSDAYRLKRLFIAGGVAALTLLPAVLIDPVVFWNATIASSISAPIRLDTSGLAGIGLDLPFWLVAAMATGVAVWMGRTGGGSSRFLLALGATLAVAFLAGFQAFMTYWFLVGALAMFGVATGLADERDNAQIGLEKHRVTSPGAVP